MLDEKEKTILSYIVSECGDSYKVIEIDDFEDFFKSKLNKKKLNLHNVLNNLQNKNFITIKYFDDNKYCLSPTQASKILFEQEYQEKTKLKKIKLEIIVLLFFVLFFAFIGSFLGTIVYNLIY